MASSLSVLLTLMALNVATQGVDVPGTCPFFPIPAECPPFPENDCESDDQCAKSHPGLDLKCCKDGCSLRCVPPIPPPTPAPQRVMGIT
ncbi:WAP four-disulfide core domain protein 2 [Nematostella vectensis]|uniref:WAP four-disulfide core domain protein 2 n=1 Tax=Nematostella vectensis TaxID=45351 RepID=UPI002076E2D1|nr:WAP four-disulfide core domain protein 2 [Nematostella vectensis]